MECHEHLGALGSTGEPTLRSRRHSHIQNSEGDGTLQTHKHRVILVDDEEPFLRATQRSLGGIFDIVLCSSGREALEAFEEVEPAVLVTDQNMPQMSGLELLTEIAKRYPSACTERILMSGYADVEVLKQFVNACEISRFVAKPFSPEELRSAIYQCSQSYSLEVQRTDREATLEAQNKKLARENETLRRAAGFESIVGSSPALRKALLALERVRRTDVTVYISGETGTGKELVAKALHTGGPRSRSPFIAQNCGGLTESLLQSTLFGHRKGAFTGATRDQPGLFHEADGGTLFLDEVAELSLSTQSMLLRVLQEGEITPIGSSRPEQVDVRLISATHKDLRQEVRAGRFREDLYFRLVVVGIELPPLRNREGDISLLAKHFLDLYTAKYSTPPLRLSAEVLGALERYDWPGNVRELANEIERLVVLSSGSEIDQLNLLSPRIVDLDPRSQTPNREPSTGVFIRYGVHYDEAIRTLATALIQHAMCHEEGVIRRAAQRLGMERSRLAKMRRRLGLAGSARASSER
ncbi:MAG: sigma-54 dependent transcriptional regulator [Myxococcota bacterium]